MGWLYFLAGLFVGNLSAFVAIACVQIAGRGHETMPPAQSTAPFTRTRGEDPARKNPTRVWREDD